PRRVHRPVRSDKESELLHKPATDSRARIEHCSRGQIIYGYLRPLRRRFPEIGPVAKHGGFIAIGCWAHPVGPPYTRSGRGIDARDVSKTSHYQVAAWRKRWALCRALVNRVL